MRRIRDFVAARQVAVVIALTGLTLAVLSIWGPHDGSGASICPSRTIFGFTCPGCGLTRATLALFRGDWAESWTYHPLAGVILLQLIVAAIVTAQVRRKRRALSPRLIPGWLTANVIALLAVWLIRIPLDALPPA